MLLAQLTAVKVVQALSSRAAALQAAGAGVASRRVASRRPAGGGRRNTFTPAVCSHASQPKAALLCVCFCFIVLTSDLPGSSVQNTRIPLRGKKAGTKNIIFPACPPPEECRCRPAAMGDQEDLSLPGLRCHFCPEQTLARPINPQTTPQATSAPA